MRSGRPQREDTAGYPWQATVSLLPQENHRKKQGVVFFENGEKCGLPIVADAKVPPLARRGGPGHSAIAYEGVNLARGDRIEVGLEFSLLPLGNHLDAPIGEVAHEAGHRKTLSQAAAGVAETHALDVPLEEDLDAPRFHAAHYASGDRSGQGVKSRVTPLEPAMQCW